MSIASISKKLNISLDLLYSIYGHKAYNSLTKGIIFQKRNPWDSKISEESEEVVKQIIQLLLDGKTYDEISDITKVRKGKISDIRCKREWQWLTKDIMFPKLKVSHPNKKRKINQYNKQGRYLKTFDSASDAIKELKDVKLHYSAITKSCKDLTNAITSGGYLWKYYDEYSDCKDLIIVKKVVKRNRIAVNQYSQDDVLLNTYSSYYDGYNATGVSASMISNACKTGKIAGGYIWRHAS